MKYDLSTGTVQQEISFHQSKENSLTHIKKQIELPEVKVTLNLLKGADKTKLLLQFTHDTKLENELKET
jgi:hypothetical protein